MGQCSGYLLTICKHGHITRRQPRFSVVVNIHPRKNQFHTIRSLFGSSPATNGSILPYPDQPFRVSRPIDPELLKAAGCFTRFEARANARDDIANLGVKRAVADFAGRIDAHVATVTAAATTASLSFIECRPDRLKLLSYLNEIRFVRDDDNELHDSELAEGTYKQLDHAMNPYNKKSPNNSPTSLIMQKLFYNVMLECFEIDTALAIDMIKSYSKQWLKTVDIKPVPAITFDEYLRHRAGDSSTRVFWWMTAFGHGTRMTEQEFDMLNPLLYRLERVVLLTNDYFSWHEEKLQPLSQITNSVLFLMRSEALSEQDALSRVKQAIIDEESAYLVVRDEFCAAHPDLASHLRQLVNVFEPVMAGYHYWAAIRPRLSGWKDGNNSPPVFNLAARMEQDRKRQRGIQGIPPAYDQDATAKTDGSGGGSAHSLDSTALLAPISYMRAMPSKQVLPKMADAMNFWLYVPAATVNVIKDVVNYLQNAALILDDIQDGSHLRRGSATAHIVFGAAQAINSGAYMMTHASRRIHELQQPALTTALLESMEGLFLGQSWELNWRHTMCCPSEEEYLAMIDKKTGGMFDMLFGLMVAAADEEFKSKNASFDTLGRLLGRWYQVRDDYMNLQGAEYAKQKGFCEDLDEGKFSYPVIRCCASDAASRDIIMTIFREKQASNMTTLPLASKIRILGLMETSRALYETWSLIVELEREAEEEVGRLEECLGETNPALRVLIKMLATDIPKPTSGK